MTSAKQPRLYALDNLRGLMMWLGIVLHSAVIYTASGPVLPWHDDITTPVADILVALIHVFRMPVFFVIAGFFAALLVQSRGAAGLARNRFSRLLVPFVVFFVPLALLQDTFAVLFLTRMYNDGQWVISTEHLIGKLMQPDTMHLWFIWLLMGISFTTALLYPLLSRLPVMLKLGDVVAAITRNGFGFVLLVIPGVLAGMNYPSGVVEAKWAFVPPLEEWVRYAAPFFVGFCIYRHQDAVFQVLQRRWIWNAVLGALFYGAAQQWGPSLHKLGLSFANNAAIWLWSLAIIGVALRHASKTSPLLGYLAESSYFVYLIHMSLTILFGLLLYKVNLPALVKLPLVITGTTIVSLLLYHHAVRFTFVGQMLNGKRHERGTAAVVRDTAAA